MNAEKRQQIQEETKEEWNRVKDFDHPHLMKYLGVEFHNVCHLYLCLMSIYLGICDPLLLLYHRHSDFD